MKKFIMRFVIKLILILQFSFTLAQTEQDLLLFINRRVGHLGYRLQDGTVVVKPELCSATMEDIDGYYLVSKAEHYYENGKRKEQHIPNTERFALLNKKGEFVIGFENNYEFIHITNGTIRVTKNNLDGIVNSKNEILVPIEYNFLNILNQEIIIAQKKEKQGVINIHNKIIIPIIYDKVFYSEIIERVEIESSNNFYFIVSKGKLEGVLNKENKFIIPLSRENIQSIITKNSMFIKKNNKFMLVDFKFKPIISKSFEKMQLRGSNPKIIYAKDGDYEYEYTIDGNLLKKSRQKVKQKIEKKLPPTRAINNAGFGT